MEKIIKKIMIPKYVQVQSDEFEEAEIYKTSDGTQFASEDDAWEHEFELRYGEDNLSVDTGELVATGYSWHKARDQEELEYMLHRFSRGYAAQNTKNIKVGEWFSVVYEFDSNGPDTATFVPLSALKQDIKELLEQLAD